MAMRKIEAAPDDSYRQTLKNIGRIIADKRKQAGLTQNQLAALLKVTSLTVSRIENGSIAPNMTRLCQLSEYLKCGLDEFMAGEPRHTLIAKETLLARKILQSVSPEKRPHMIKIAHHMVEIVK